MLRVRIHYVWETTNNLLRKPLHLTAAHSRRAVRLLAPLTLVLALSACGPAPMATGINDPYEASNRRVHAFNKTLDRNFVSPGADAYGSTIPEPVRNGVTNFAGNIDLPRVVVNDLLQGNIEDAAHNTVRFVLNTTIGLGGLLDPATEFGVAPRPSNFGETLYVWGLREGRYLELPVLGPSTERDAAGRVVDFVLNPLRYNLPDAERDAAAALGLFSRFNDRYRFSATVDSVLYDSADSYAQARLLYLQNRRFQLGGTAGIDYSGATGDPGFDPYEDPYAE